ncbi:hypothetical protein [Streptomyces alboverticillatus]|uniref:hypothetical protein n=1 Tax=Streptomyces alboverticillatus TaxID=173770 RepID=UPI001180C231|nr:hypothetical protein [Streptomyces alboverticillatus]
MNEALTMGLLFLAVFGSFCGFLTWQLVSRLLSLFGGIAVEGRCVRRYSAESSDNGTSWHHVYGFTTRDGRYVERGSGRPGPSAGSAPRPLPG